MPNQGRSLISNPNHQRDIPLRFVRDSDVGFEYIGRVKLGEGATAMNIEIREPELERRVREGIQSGRFHDVDDLLSKALDALSESSRDRRALDWSQCLAVESVPGK